MSVLTNVQGQSLIENYCQTKDVKFIKYELLPMSEVAEGYMGEHYNLRVTYLKNNTATVTDFFMKHTPTKNKAQMELAQQSNMYAREIFLYYDLFKQFKKLGFDVSFSPECYYCIPDTALIMENMKTLGYETKERNINFNKQEINCVLENLAKYHAAGFAYEAIKSLQNKRKYRLIDDYNEFLSEPFFIENTPEMESTASYDFWKGCRTTLTVLTDLLPFNETQKTFLKKYINEHKLMEPFIKNTKYAKTLGHGDLWSNNILFKRDEQTNEISCNIVDYQCMRYFYPSFDVLLVIYSNTSREFRNEHLRELCDYYYNCLTDIYHNYGFTLNDIMTKKEYEETFDLIKIEAVYQVTAVSAVTCIPKEILDEKNKTGDDYMEVFFNNSKISAEAFQTDNVFKTVLSELLTDLYETFENTYKCNTD